ncbi:MAG: tetratricopeptide repeat protein [Gammaproteobacteria bacterium]|jgi:predicted negative regulator of RcsB-dependent stress response|nr:hypothetical protein [Gammaproteobacteria bacterium]MBQ08740.1 hypothetical protein [Gammaproteobacteria bacterium]MDP6147338.1 tetratricopeptide repeat protein [Gammaproteobacteria bacterium]HJL80161.1 tetratricopeptide repeat protein [Gammaproteobacteria bacterium]HJM08561.1 tetratricopeptide repeat protein [Gammaproteobacteria bacterium]|tara:strand:+ start:41360 stop:42019 length:660 start_codon:yes stop_codon:yes gene_type:complete
MNDNLTDQQQAEIVKKWLKDNGLFIVASFGIAISGVFGMQYYKNSNLKQAENASRLYADMEFSVRQKRLSQAQTILQQMDNDFSGSAYQIQSHLSMAKLFMDSLDYDNAITQLEFVLEQADDENFSMVARQRIARIYIEKGDFQDALDLLGKAEFPEAFEAQFEIIKGDAYLGMGEEENARSAYEIALKSLSPGSFAYDFTKMKFEQINQNNEDEDTQT